MAVCTEYDVARFDIASLCHQLMADSVASVYVFHSVFLCKSISCMEMSGIIKLACRNKVVIDQDYLIRIP